MMKDTLTYVLHKSISFKNKTVTSNHISLDAIVSRSKPELPVVSACSTLSLPWRFLEGFQAGCTLDSRSPGQAQTPLHPLTVSQIPYCPLQYVDSFSVRTSQSPCPSATPSDVLWFHTHTYTQAPITRISEILHCLAQLLSLCLSRSEILSLQLTAKCGYQTSLVWWAEVHETLSLQLLKCGLLYPQLPPYFNSNSF